MIERLQSPEVTERVFDAMFRGSAELSEIQRKEWVKLQQLAKGQGLKQSSERFGVWLPRDQEERGPGSIPSKFFVKGYDQQGEVMLEQHEFNFPIQDLAQLTKSLEALGALYKADPTYDLVRDSRDRFVQIVSSLAEPKQPKV